MLKIRSHTNPNLTAELVQDVCHEHPAWVHEQIGTNSESELQHFLDSCSYAEFATSPGKTDDAGVYWEDEDNGFTRMTVNGAIRVLSELAYGEAALVPLYPDEWMAIAGRVEMRGDEIDMTEKGIEKSLKVTEPSEAPDGWGWEVGYCIIDGPIRMFEWGWVATID